MNVDKFPHYSGMDFVTNNAFVIETSLQYTSLDKSVRSVEFVRAEDDNLMFIEAKSSFPKPDDANAAKTARFIEEVGTICDKFTHSLNLYSAIRVGVANNNLPDDFKPADKVSIVFVLVINGFDRGWCIPIRNALTQKINQSLIMAKIWKPEVFVINDKAAAMRKITVG
jgi:hypothetical protein